jgi:hypothetical protein
MGVVVSVLAVGLKANPPWSSLSRGRRSAAGEHDGRTERTEEGGADHEMHRAHVWVEGELDAQDAQQHLKED